MFKMYRLLETFRLSGGRSLELKKFSFLYGYNRILYVNDIPAITAILESFPVHDCTLSFRESKTQLLQTNWKPKGLDPNYQLRVTDIPTHPLPSIHNWIKPKLHTVLQSQEGY
ncbi:hypothetical protein Anas_02885 [Armadillidium nasatum]|uniref:Uncharacterized protein n=1 Tax=Armadillidium nasatum TaxID=96803 RepID=A0A5N5TMC1_9CRUS|nr:hypothetical protein Anas_02885 [Armadillidium nasatum]